MISQKTAIAFKNTIAGNYPITIEDETVSAYIL